MAQNLTHVIVEPDDIRRDGELLDCDAEEIVLNLRLAGCLVMRLGIGNHLPGTSWTGAPSLRKPYSERQGRSLPSLR